MSVIANAGVLTTRINLLSRMSGFIGAVMVVLIGLVLVADVLLRYLFNEPIIGAAEFVGAAMVVIFFFGLAYTLMHDSFIRMRLAATWFPEKTQAVIDTWTELFSLVLFSVITWQIVDWAIRQHHPGARIEGLPVSPTLVIALAGFGTALISVMLIIRFSSALAKVLKMGMSVLPSLCLWSVIALVLATIPLWLKWLPFGVSPQIVGVIGIAILLILLGSGMYVGPAMILSGFLGLASVISFEDALPVLALTPYREISSYTLSVVPLFMLMGQVCFEGELSRDIFATAQKWMGHLPGGLAMATIGGCAGFAAICGSSLACAVTMCTVALPEMKRYNYSPTLATGTLAAGGTLGILIPPSLAFVFYAMITQQSIGKLFIAGILPGILLAVLFMLLIYTLVRIYPIMGPPGPKTSLVDKLLSLKSSVLVLFLFVVVIGGIYSGVFNATEAAAVGAFLSVVIWISKRKFTWKGLTTTILETERTSVMVLIFLIGAMVLGYFMAVTKIPFALSELATTFGMSRYAVLALFLFVLLVAGCIGETLPMMLIILPVIFPTLISYGFDPIWFGVIMVIMIEMGMITPPIGTNVFAIASMTKDVGVTTVFLGANYFVLAMAVLIVLLVLFPQIALFLPNLGG